MTEIVPPAGAARPAGNATAAHPPAPVWRPAMTGVALVLAGALAIAAEILSRSPDRPGGAATSVITVLVALAMLVLVQGWSALHALPSPRGSTAALAVATLALFGAVAATTGLLGAQRVPTDDLASGSALWIVAALALAMIGEFIHEIARKDGRERLVASMSATVSGAVVLASGVAMLPVLDLAGGAMALSVLGASVGLSALADPLLSVRRVRASGVWAVAALLGASGAGLAVAGHVGDPTEPWRSAVLVGALAGAVSHAWRRASLSLETLPAPRLELSAGAASVLVVGVLAPALTWLLRMG